ncbi:MAG: hypothetical protein ACHQF3_08590 [Alphaproteobacteria bacterium]
MTQPYATPAARAAAAAALAAAAYSEPPRYRWRDVHAVRSDAGGIPLVAFRGTTRALEDWLRDLEAWPERCPQLGWCHAGFLGGARAIERALWLEFMRSGTRPLLAGHSLGGALALLTGALLAAHGVAPVAIVTFGAPRAGFAKLRRVLRHVPVEQYRFGEDIVPTVPWALWPLLRYAHVRPPMRIGNGTGDPLADHHIANYLRALTP